MRKLKYPELIGEMARRGETPSELAEQIGIKYSAIWRRLKGRTEWNISEIDKVCELYNKSYEELFKKAGN